MRPITAVLLFFIVVAGTTAIYLGVRVSSPSRHHLSCAPTVGVTVPGWVDPLAQKGCPQNP